MNRALRSSMMASAFLIPVVLAILLSPVSADTQDYYPGTETAVKGTVGGAAFPGAIQTSDDSYRTPQEANQAVTTDLTADTETLTKANSVSGTITSLNADDGSSRVVSEANQATADYQATLYPNADGYLGEWVTAGTPACDTLTPWYDDVDDGATQDDDTTCRQGLTNNLIIAVGMEDAGISGSPADVDVCVRGFFEDDANGANTIRHLIRSGTTNSFSGTYSVPNAGTGYPAAPWFCLDTDPADAGDWTDADIDAIQVGADTPDATPDPRVTAFEMIVWANYTADFELEYRLSWTTESCTGTWRLTVNSWRGTDMENVEVQIAAADETFGAAAFTVTATTDGTTQTADLSADQQDSGNPDIRAVGTTESGDTAQGQFNMDYIVIQCIPAADFESEMKYDWTGVDTSGNSWTLWVECKRVTNPEDYLVQVVDSTEASWVTRYTCDQNGDTSYSSYQLSTDELDGGSPNVRFIGASESGDGSQSTWDIDLLKIVREFTSNAVPTLTLNYANPYTITRDQSVDFGTTYTDADDEAPSYIKITLSPAGTNRTLDENNTGDTTYTDGKAYHLTDAANTYCPSSQTFFFSTSDGQAGHAIRSGSQTLTVSNTVPAITNGGSAPVTVIHGNDYSFDFDASDVDVPVCQSFTWTKLVGPAWLVIDGGTGVLSGTAPDDTGGNAVTVRVSDGTATNDFPFTITVTNAAPTWTANSPSSTVHHGDPYSYDFNAADTDPLDYIYFSKDAGPGWLGINAATGVYSGTAPHTLASGGSNTVTVHDQAIPNGTAQHIWTITITNENPAFTSGEQVSQTAQNDTLYAHDYNAADASGDYLYFTFVTNNTDLNIGPLNGTVWGHLTTLGTFYVNVTVHDDADPNGTDWNNYTLVVSLQPPEIGGGDSGGAIGAGAILAILLAIAIGIGFGLPIARRKKKRGFKAPRRAGVTSKRGGISAPKRGFRIRRRLGGS